MMGGSLKTIKLHIDDRDYIIRNPGQNECDKTIFFESEEYFKKYVHHEKEFYQTIINKNTISRYSESLIDALNKYPRPPQSCLFEDNPDAGHMSSVDINKAYTELVINEIYSGI